MTTIVVHGTMAMGATWYQSAWEGEGFLAGLNIAMLETSGQQDIWQVNNEHVSNYAALGKVYEWSGLPEGLYRGIAAGELARYLNIVASLTDEPIRIIAHSHGCNVVKLASSLPELSPQVMIEQAVFLACPHFYEDQYKQEQLSGLDQFDIRKVHQGYKKSGYRFRYALDPQRFGRILNVYCQQDSVQVDLAESFSGGMVPLNGSFLENVMKQLTDGILELPRAARQDMDDNARQCYEEQEVFVEPSCSGIHTHSVMHGFIMGMLAGSWLNSGLSVQQLLQERGTLPLLECSDTGG